MILLMCVSSVFSKNDQEVSDVKSLLMVSIIGVSMFVMLFEGRARYLYTFAPIFAMVASFGLKVVIDNFE